VVRGEVPPAIRRSVELWIGCVAGALEEQEYRDKLAKVGFAGIDVEPTRIYRMEDARSSWPARGWTPRPSLRSGRQVHERVRPRAKSPCCLTPLVEGR